MEVFISTSSIFVLGLFFGALLGRLVTFSILAAGCVVIFLRQLQKMLDIIASPVILYS